MEMNRRNFIQKTLALLGIGAGGTALATSAMPLKSSVETCMRAEHADFHTRNLMVARKTMDRLKGCNCSWKWNPERQSWEHLPNCPLSGNYRRRVARTGEAPRSLSAPVRCSCGWMWNFKHQTWEHAPDCALHGVRKPSREPQEPR